MSRVSREPSTSCNFVRDGAPGKPNSLNDSLLQSLHPGRGAKVREPCVVLVQCHFEHQVEITRWGSHCCNDTLCSEVLSARIPSATVRVMQLGVVWRWTALRCNET